MVLLKIFIFFWIVTCLSVFFRIVIQGTLNIEASSCIPPESVIIILLSFSNFKKSSISLEELLSENKDKLGTSITNVEIATGNFAKISDSLVNANLSQTITKLKSTISNFDNILKRNAGTSSWTVVEPRCHFTK